MISKKKAIQKLKSVKLELDNAQLRNSSWITNTKSVIQEIFSENSPEYKHIESFKFQRIDIIGYTQQAQQNWYQQNLSEAKQFLDNCVKKVEFSGPWIPPSPKFLTVFTQEWLLATIFTLIFSSFLFGNHLGKKGYDISDIDSYVKVFSFSKADTLNNSFSKNMDTLKIGSTPRK